MAGTQAKETASRCGLYTPVSLGFSACPWRVFPVSGEWPPAQPNSDAKAQAARRAKHRTRSWVRCRTGVACRWWPAYSGTLLMHKLGLSDATRRTAQVRCHASLACRARGRNGSKERLIVRYLSCRTALENGSNA
jgi:hypothetical protein